MRRMISSAALALCSALALCAPAHAATAPVPRGDALYEDGPSGRYLLDSGWSTRADTRDAGERRGWQQPGYRAGFRPVIVPNAFNARDLTRRGQRSRVQWYRVRFRLPAAPASARWRLRFESVNVTAR